MVPEVKIEYDRTGAKTVKMTALRLTLRYWSRMIPPGICCCRRSATPAIVKEFSHEACMRSKWMLYLCGIRESPRRPLSVCGRPLRQVRAGRLPSPIVARQPDMHENGRQGTYEGHFVGHRDDHGISLICSIQHAFRLEGMNSLTLTAHAIARPIPEQNANKQRRL